MEVETMKRLTLGLTMLMAGLTTSVMAAEGQERTADERDGKNPARCNAGMLHGTYGVTLSGLRPGAAGVQEQFVGVSMQTYDGHGNFTQTDNTHGLSASVTDQP